MPNQLSILELEKSGLKIPVEKIYSQDDPGLMGAVIHLGGGTASFVSKEGLILTNHHVAYGALQRASDIDHDYLKNGFMAWTREQEIPAPGVHADVFLGFEDCTDQIMKGLHPDMAVSDLKTAIERNKNKIIKETEMTESGVRAEIAEIFGGKFYYLYKFKRLNDIRIVYAPPIDIANFGGDIDNWMWPRHTGDFTFLRAYVSEDNQGADFNRENIPFRPENYLKISGDDIDDQDLNFVIGYPGRTYRNFTFNEFEWSAEFLKIKLKQYLKVENFFSEIVSADRAREIKYASKIRGLNNSIKNYQGKIDQFEQQNLFELKEKSQKELEKWIHQNPDRKNKYGNLFNDSKKIVEERKEAEILYDDLSSWVDPYRGPTLLYQAHLITRAVQERKKLDIERDPGFQERNYASLRNKIKIAERSYDESVDRILFKLRLDSLRWISTQYIPNALRKFSDKSSSYIDSLVDSWYSLTALTDPEIRLKLFEMDEDELNKINDPLLDLAIQLEKELSIVREQRELLHFKEDISKRKYFEALIEIKNDRLAPDANSTIRFTYGWINGYSPRDAIQYLPQTSLTGMVQKNSREFPFRVPEKLIDLSKSINADNYIDPELNDIPVCFLNTTNVTGGNSGSPTLNAKGELIGLIFDMTYESIIGDYYILPEYQRSISVDIRYILFLTDKFSKGKHILRELGF
ncbi:MAG: S46 family peptidase [Calditrichaeota bacterium]|nr:S46 family peptidase [Calditrichota bacterium]